MMSIQGQAVYRGSVRYLSKRSVLQDGTRNDNQWGAASLDVVEVQGFEIRCACCR